MRLPLIRAQCLRLSEMFHDGNRAALGLALTHDFYIPFGEVDSQAHLGAVHIAKAHIFIKTIAGSLTDIRQRKSAAFPD